MSEEFNRRKWRYAEFAMNSKELGTTRGPWAFEWRNTVDHGNWHIGPATQNRDGNPTVMTTAAIVPGCCGTEMSRNARLVSCAPELFVHLARMLDRFHDAMPEEQAEEVYTLLKRASR